MTAIVNYTGKTMKTSSRLVLGLALPAVCFAALAAQTVTPQGAAPRPGAAADAPGTGIVAGRVVDASGAPVPFAIVMLAGGPAIPAGRGSAPGARVLSDEMGRFVFTNVAAGRLRIEASKPGWLSGALGRKRPNGAGSTFNLADGERINTFVVTLWRAAVIAGRVTDDKGDPLIDVEVRAVRQTYVAGRRQSETPIRAKTDDLGAFRFSGLLPGDYLIASLTSVLSEPPGLAGASAQGRQQTYLQTMAAVGSAPMLFEPATGVVGPGRSLVGSLSPLGSAPSADAPWPMYPTTYHPSSLTMASASLVRVNAGDVREDAHVRVPLTRSFTVSGVVRDADGPCAWHAVHLVPAETGETPLVDVATSVTDQNGLFTFYGVPSGRYIARVVRVPWPSAGSELGVAGGTGAIPYIAQFGRGPSAGPPAPPADPLFHASEAVTVADRAVRDLTMTLRPGPRVRGRAVFEGDRPQPTATEWATAQIIMVPASGRTDSFIWPRAFSDAGTFESASVWPGRYVIRATPPPGWLFKTATYEGRDVSEGPIDLTADLANVVVTFVSQTETIKGRVQVEPGALLDEATVLLFPADPAQWTDAPPGTRRFASSRVSAAGDFTLPPPPPGEYFMIAVPEDATADWQNPEFLRRLSPMAERVRVTGASITQPLQLKRVR